MKQHLGSRMKKVAVFIDWENLRLDIHHIQRTHINRRDITFNYNSIRDITFLIHSFIDTSEDISKIFFYTALPLSQDEIDKKAKPLPQEIQSKITAYASTTSEKIRKIHKQVSSFIKHIAFEEYFAVRLGELKISGFDPNGRPIISQKQVDMLLGLDISHIAYQKLADKVIIFCKDTDITPALKCARVNGLEVIIASIKEGYKVADKLRKHSDVLRERSLITIANNLKGVSND